MVRGPELPLKYKVPAELGGGAIVPYETSQEFAHFESFNTTGQEQLPSLE